MPLRPVPPSPKRRLARRLSPVLVVAAMVAALLGLIPAPAQAAAKWNSGSTKYTTITNCPSIIWGNPYQEYGIGAFVSYWGDQQSNPITPAVGETTYLDTYAMLIGSHCGTPYIFPKFVLPAGVEFDRTQAIKCYYTPPGGTQYQITNATECPQWANVSASGSYSNAKSGWNSGWPLPSGQNYTNGSAWEFLVPVKATSQQWGSQLRTELSIADGNAGPTLGLTVPFYTGAPAVTAPGAPTNVTANATSPTSAQVAFSPPASNGGAAITGYTARCESADGGVARTVTGAGSPISVTGLTADRSYSCDVRATNNVGSGAWSTRSATFATPRATTAPGSPTDVSATVLSSSSVRVAFNPPADDGGSAITSYRLLCTSPDGAASRIKDGTSSPLTITTLSPATRYQCQVRATNAVGTGAYSPSTAIFTTPAAVPSRPVDVKAVALSSTTARVTFPAPAANGSPITGYRAQCVSTDGGVTRYGRATASPIKAATMTPGKQYHCRVQATNAVGNSYWSPFSPTFRLPR